MQVLEKSAPATQLLLVDLQPVCILKKVTPVFRVPKSICTSNFSPEELQPFCSYLKYQQRTGTADPTDVAFVKVLLSQPVRESALVTQELKERGIQAIPWQYLLGAVEMYENTLHNALSLAPQLPYKYPNFQLSLKRTTVAGEKNIALSRVLPVMSSVYVVAYPTK